VVADVADVEAAVAAGHAAFLKWRTVPAPVPACRSASGGGSGHGGVDLALDQDGGAVGNA
jgi:hypothetical protein